MNPFLQGAPYTQIQRVMEFACEYHALQASRANLPWLTISAQQAIQELQNAFFDPCVCVATQAAIIKALALIRVFDGCSKSIIGNFLNRAKMDNHAHFIVDAMQKLERLNNVY